MYLQLDYKQSEDRDCHVFCQPIPTFPSPITFINSKYVVRQINYETIQVKITKKIRDLHNKIKLNHSQDSQVGNNCANTITYKAESPQSE